MRTHRERLIGLHVSHVWCGHGSAIFIEFGELNHTVKRDGTLGNPRGQFTLMIEWSWRIEKGRAITIGSFSSSTKWQAVFNRLISAEVLDVDCFGVIPEIVVTLSNGYRVLSFMTDKGQPSWALISRDPILGTLSVKSGKLCIEAVPQ